MTAEILAGPFGRITCASETVPCCSELTAEVLETGPVCVCVRGELVVDGERGGRLAAAFGEAIMDLTLSDRTCICGGEYTSPSSAVATCQDTNVTQRQHPMTALICRTGEQPSEWQPCLTLGQASQQLMFACNRALIHVCNHVNALQGSVY